jgi:hypothetical protein
MKPSGAHTHTDGGGGGGAVLAVIALVLVGAAIARPVAHAAEEVLRVVVLAAEILAGAAVAGLGTWAAIAIARNRKDRSAALPRPASTTGRVLPPAGRSAPRSALPSPAPELHLHLHGVSPADVAELVRRNSLPTGQDDAP